MREGVVLVVLDGQAFRDLVAGKELVSADQIPEQPAVRIRLADIGWDLMRSAIDDAEAAVAAAPGGSPG